MPRTRLCDGNTAVIHDNTNTHPARTQGGALNVDRSTFKVMVCDVEETSGHLAGGVKGHYPPLVG